MTAPVPTAEPRHPSAWTASSSWITASAADPVEAALENAVLAWAQNDAAVAERVAAIETRRTTNAEQLLAALGFAPDDAALWADIGYTTFVGMMNRSTRDPRFRQWPRSDYLARVVDAARRLLEHRDNSWANGETQGESRVGIHRHLAQPQSRDSPTTVGVTLPC